MTAFPPEWRFTSTVETPDGLRVECSVTLPAPGPADVFELGELADIASRRVAVGWQQAAERRQRDALEAEGCPF